MQIVVVPAAANWSDSHPRLATGDIIAALEWRGHEAGYVPIALDPPRDATATTHGLSLLPFGAYGDLLLGLGWAALSLHHRRKVIVCDEDVVALLGRSGADQPLNRVLREESHGDARVVATSAEVEEQLASVGVVVHDVVESVDELVDAAGIPDETR